ncbi:MAG: sulfur oxidation c-type cytochrome SoxX [Usitatibacter sp.]
MRWAVAMAAASLAACAAMPRDALDTPLAPSGDAARGREIFLAKDEARCVLCHAVPGAAVAGDVGPSLAGVGSRLTAGQIRLRVADITRVNPSSVMPTFHRTEGMVRVAPEYRGKPVLEAQQVEDLVAWLETLR